MNDAQQSVAAPKKSTDAPTYSEVATRVVDPPEEADNLESKKLLAETRKLNAEIAHLEAALWARPAFWASIATIIGTLFGVFTLYVNGYFSANLARLSTKEERLRTVEKQIADAESELKRLTSERDMFALALADRSLQNARNELAQFFDRAQIHLETIWRLCSREDGTVSRSLVQIRQDATDNDQLELIKQLNSVFVPLIQDNPYISSMMIVDSHGLEYVLLHEDAYESQEAEYKPYEWRNRIMRVDEWGQRAIEQYWEDRHALTPKGEPKDIPNLTAMLGSLNIDGVDRDYDPRYRRYTHWWLVRKDNQEEFDRLWGKFQKSIHWTLPYVFYTTKTVGITASRGWTVNGNEDTRYVVAVDFTLTELSLATTKLGIGNRGIVFVFTDNGAIIGLPRHRSFRSEKAMLEFFHSVMGKRGAPKPDEEPTLLHVDEMASKLGLEALVDSYSEWRAKGRPTIVSFKSGNEPWMGRFESFTYPQSNRKVWIAAIAPTGRLLPITRNDD